MARILAVDDEQNILMVLQTLLKSMGHEVTTTQDGNEVIKILQTDQQIDLLLSDVRMHPMNGMELLEKSKKIRPSLPVILLTAYFSKESREKAEKLGARELLPKPFDMKILLDSINKALSMNDT